MTIRFSRGGLRTTVATAALATLLGSGLATPAAAQPTPAPTPGFITATPTREAPEPHPQLAALGAAEAWRHATGAGVIVAVLDSGVDASHPGLAGRVLAGSDHVDGSTGGTSDPVGHGTTVASLIAGFQDDVAIGLAPDATILPVRVLDERNRYRSAATVAEGVRWAIEQGADVINLSLGGQGHSAALSAAIDLAMANDVVVIACTGNDYGQAATGVWYPAREPGVVAVAGLARTDAGDLVAWPDSLTGPQTVLSAPAVVTGARPGGEYRTVQGTSFSAALVAATAALIRSQWPDLPAGDVVHRLVATAEDLGPPGRDPEHGFGAVDPAAALTASVPRVYSNPLDTKARHGTGGFGPAPQGPPDLPDGSDDGPDGEEAAPRAPDTATDPNAGRDDQAGPDLDEAAGRRSDPAGITFPEPQPVLTPVAATGSGAPTGIGR